MRFLISSENDEASMNIHARLLEQGSWQEEESFEGRPCYSLKNFKLVTIAQEHIFRDNLDDDLNSTFGEKPEAITYLSRHRSESGSKSLTVHPIGNYRQADFGGRAKTLVPSAPSIMTGTLRELRNVATDLDYSISYEATHHGPFLKTPTFFIEIGSTMTEWSDLAAAKSIATAILNAKIGKGPIGIGIGGGHYMPRITDVALGRIANFGHMIPSYALSEWDESLFLNALSETPGADFVYFHRKALEKPTLRKMEIWFKEHGIRVAREEDLQPL